jgi:hypothetical protein
MSGTFGKRPKMPALPVTSPKPMDVASTDVRKNTYRELAKRRRATVLNQLTAQPTTLRRTLGGS